MRSGRRCPWSVSSCCGDGYDGEDDAGSYGEAVGGGEVEASRPVSWQVGDGGGWGPDFHGCPPWSVAWFCGLFWVLRWFVVAAVLSWSPCPLCGPWWGCSVGSAVSQSGSASISSLARQSAADR